MRYGLAVIAFCFPLFAGAGLADRENLFLYKIPDGYFSKNISDLKSWNDVGELNRVGVKDGHLFADGRRIRFFGVNMVYGGAMPSKEDASLIAGRLARFGINAVRIHHIDSRPAPNGVLQADMQSIDFNQLDRLDYFIACLKKAGVYVDLNLHVGRNYPGFKKWSDFLGNESPIVWKGVDLFYPPMVEQQRKYAAELLGHKNPYTGRKYSDDPAIAVVELNNENGLLDQWLSGALDNMSGSIELELRKLWSEWYLKKNSNAGPILKSNDFSTKRNLSAKESLSVDNGTIEAADWRLQTTQGAEGEVVDVYNDIRKLTVERPGAEGWSVQLLKEGISLRRNSPYFFSIRLKSDRPRLLTVSATEGGGAYRSLWRTKIEVGTEWRDFNFSVIPLSNTAGGRLVLSDLGSERGVLWFSSSTRTSRKMMVGKLGSEGGNDLRSIVRRRDFDALSTQDQKDWLSFLWDVEEKYWADMYLFLREDLNVKSLILGSQVNFSPSLIQKKFDIVDGHAYWDHPQFFGKRWDPANWRIRNSPMAGVDGAGTIADLGFKRVPGKPFFVTEYNHSAPGDFASEAMPLISAYGALQDWDGIFLYAYGTHRGSWSSGYVDNYFDIYSDPNKLSSLVASAALFRRGDVRSSTKVASVGPLRDRVLEVMGALKLVPGAEMFGVSRNEALRSWVSFNTEPTGEVKIPVVSETGELVWGAYAHKAVTIDTKRSKGIIGQRLPAEFNASGVRFQLVRSITGSAVLLATVIEGSDFLGPARVLITALGKEENSNQQWVDSTHRSVGQSWGNAPVLVEGVEANVTFPVDASRVEAWALDERGERKFQLDVSGGRQAVVSIHPRYRSVWFEVDIH